MAMTVSVRGTVLTGVPDAELTKALELAQEAVGAQVLADWHQNLNAAIKHPTPYYETQIQVARRDKDVVVNDRNIVYGPWLEGVSSRNETSRFKGYTALRRARQSAEQKIPAVVQPIISAFAALMNGGA